MFPSVNSGWRYVYKNLPIIFTDMINLENDGHIDMKEIRKFRVWENKMRCKFERGELDTERISP